MSKDRSSQPSIGVVQQLLQNPSLGTASAGPSTPQTLTKDQENQLKLHQKRMEALLRDVNKSKDKYQAIQQGSSVPNDPILTEINDLEATIRQTDLTSSEYQPLIKRVVKLEKDVNAKCKHIPGISGGLDQLLTFKGSYEYYALVELTTTNAQDALVPLKSKVDKLTADFTTFIAQVSSAPQASAAAGGSPATAITLPKLLADLKQIQQESSLALFDLSQETNKLAVLQTRIATASLNAQALADQNTKNTYLSKLQSLTVRVATLNTSKATLAASKTDKLEERKDKFATLRQDMSDKHDLIVTDLSKIEAKILKEATSPTDPQRTRLKYLKQQLDLYAPRPGDSSWNQDIYDKIVAFSANRATQSIPETTMEGYESHLAEVRKSFADLWKFKEDQYSQAIRFAQRIKAELELSDNEFLSGDAFEKRTVAEKQREIVVDNFLTKYAKVRSLKAEGKIGEALNEFDLMDQNEGSALKALQAQQLTDYAAMPGPDEAAIDLRKQVFLASGTPENAKGHIRFSPEAMQLMLGRGVTSDSDGDLVLSDTFKKMAKELEAAAKQWQTMRKMGIDPLRAAEKAFVGIPENFWPPEAVRAIAMFRRAEAQLASERDAVELEQQINAGYLDQAVGATDKAQAALGKLDKPSQALEVLSVAYDDANVVIESMLTHRMGELAKEYNLDIKNEDDQETLQKLACESYGISQGALEDAGKALGAVMGGLSALKSLTSAAQSGMDVFAASVAIHQFDPEKDSPVKQKLEQFKRKRAIAQTINNIADAGLSTLGACAPVLPVLGDIANITSDVKQLIIEGEQAVQYFLRLLEMNSLIDGAEMDPETMMDMALAREAAKLKWLRLEKIANTITALGKLVGDTTKVIGEATQAGDGGITKIVGISIKGSASSVEVCGKIAFKLHNWWDSKQSKKALMAAKCDPDDINAIEEVFGKCTLYARTAIALAALDDDPWARAVLLNRGLTDTDLDNVQTSAALLREYLNVTFQNRSFGEAEKDDDHGINKKEDAREASRLTEAFGSETNQMRVELDNIRQKIAAGDISPANLKMERYYSQKLNAAQGAVRTNWEPTNYNLTSQDFSANYSAACTSSGMVSEPSKLAFIEKMIQAFDTATRNFVLLRTQANDAYTNAGQLTDQQKVDDALTKRKAAKEQAIALRNAFFSLQSALLFKPVAPDPASGKLSVLEPFDEYLTVLRQEMERMMIESEADSFLSDSAIDAELKFRIKSDNLDALQQAVQTDLANKQADLNKWFQSIVSLLDNDQSDFHVDTKIDELDIATKFGKFKLKTLVTDIVTRITALGQGTPDRKKMDELVKYAKAFAKAEKTGLASRLGNELAKDAHTLTNVKKLPANQVDIALVKKRDQALKKELIPQCITQTKLLVEGRINDLADDAYARLINSNVTLPASQTSATTKAYWELCVTELKAHKWEPVDVNKIGRLFQDLDSARQAWESLKSDYEYQTDARKAFTALISQLSSLSEKSTGKVAVAGIKQFKSSLIKLIKDAQTKFQADCATFGTSLTDEGWCPSAAELKQLPINSTSLKTVTQRAKKYKWKGKLPPSLVSSFDNYVQACINGEPATIAQLSATTSAAAGGAAGANVTGQSTATGTTSAARVLLDQLNNWDLGKKPHPGLHAYRVAMVKRLLGE